MTKINIKLSIFRFFFHFSWNSVFLVALQHFFKGLDYVLPDCLLMLSTYFYHNSTQLTKPSKNAQITLYKYFLHKHTLFVKIIVEYNLDNPTHMRLNNRRITEKFRT